MFSVNIGNLLASGLFECRIEDAELAFDALYGAIQGKELLSMLLESGSPSQPWRTLRDHFRPKTPGHELGLLMWIFRCKTQARFESSERLQLLFPHHIGDHCFDRRLIGSQVEQLRTP